MEQHKTRFVDLEPGEKQRKSKDHGRRYERRKAENQPITIVSDTGVNFFLLPTDHSSQGMGCIYTGSQPPESGARFTLRHEGVVRNIEVRWIQELAGNVYRLGLQYC